MFKTWQQFNFQMLVFHEIIIYVRKNIYRSQLFYFLLYWEANSEPALMNKWISVS